MSKRTSAPSTEREKQHRRRVKAVRALIIRVLSLALVVYVLFFHLVGLTVMPNADMYPRMDTGDLVLYYRLEHTFRAQDIVVLQKPTASLTPSAGESVTRPAKSVFRKALDWLGFPDPADPPATRFICRVVAGPGDTVEISDGDRLMVNGNAVIESNIFYRTPLYEGFTAYPLTLAPGQYFVLADHRTDGVDSRIFGPVDADEIQGAVITILRRNNF